jgi:hypothetical protein
LAIDINGIVTAVAALAGIALGAYGIHDGLRNYKQKIKQDKMQILLSLIKDFESENLTLAKYILDNKIVRPDTSWKNHIFFYNIKWNEIVQGNSKEFNRYLINELDLNWVKEDQQFREEENKLVTQSQEVDGYHNRTLIISPKEYLELAMEPKKGWEYLVANIVDRKVWLLSYYYHIFYLERIFRLIQPGDPIKDVGEHKIRESFDALIDFFVRLEYLMRLDLITRDDITFFEYYIEKAANEPTILKYIDHYPHALEGNLNSKLYNNKFKEKQEKLRKTGIQKIISVFESKNTISL